jgi:hypothetical protein
MDRLFRSCRPPVASLATDINNKTWSSRLTIARRRKYAAHDTEALLPELHCPLLDCDHDLDVTLIGAASKVRCYCGHALLSQCYDATPTSKRRPEEDAAS